MIEKAIAYKVIPGSLNLSRQVWPVILHINYPIEEDALDGFAVWSGWDVIQYIDAEAFDHALAHGTFVKFDVPITLPTDWRDGYKPQGSLIGNGQLGIEVKKL